MSVDAWTGEMQLGCVLSPSPLKTACTARQKGVQTVCTKTQ